MSATFQRTESVSYSPLTTNSNGASSDPAQSAAGQQRGVPTVVLIASGAAGLLLWSIVEAGSRLALGALMGLVVLGAVCWAIGLSVLHGHGQRRAERRGLLMVAGVVALAAGAAVSGTMMSPFVLLLPMAVGLIVALTGSSPYADAGLVAALTGLAATGGRGIVLLDERLLTTTLFLGCVGLLTLLAYYVAGRLNHKLSAAAALPLARPLRSAVVTQEQLERLDSAETPIDVVRIAATILDEVATPTYLAIVEQIPDTDILRPLVERGSLDVDTDRLRTGLAALSHESLAQKEPRVIVNDGTNMDSIVCRRLGVDAVLIVPLRRMGASLGAIHMAWTTLEASDQIDQAQVLAANISQWITPDIAISRVASEIERGYVNAIAAVCESLDEQSDYTSGHGHRVAKIALEIAESLVLSDHDQRQLLYVAEMHDIGKVGVGHDILAKPAALSDDEWTAVQSIPARGAGFVDSVSYFGEVGDAIRHLRERWDGAGYPDELSGEEIPLLARIVAVAEAYDAMTSDRPYREAMSSTDALRQLWRERGRKFDPAIVEAFVQRRAPRSTVPA